MLALLRSTPFVKPLVLALTIAATAPAHRVVVAASPAGATVTTLVSGLASGSGSTIGPGGALYVTEGATGRLLRVDPQSGHVSVVASGLPPAIVGIGGAMDVVFIGSTAYVLVTLVGSDVGGSSAVGIYRVDGPSEFTLIADIGSFALQHPPSTAFFVPTGVQYAIEAYRGGFLVTDGHHNRVYRITRDGEITELATFGNIVPTGLAVAGNTILMTEAGPVPHLPENGKLVMFTPQSPSPQLVASGARLLVDVEFGRGQRLYALSQGFFTPGHPEGSPADPDTGALVEVNANGTFSTIVSGLNQPTSLEFIGDTAYVVTLTGQILRIELGSTPPFGRSR